MLRHVEKLATTVIFVKPIGNSEPIENSKPHNITIRYGGFGLGYRRGVAVLEQGGWVEQGKLGHSRLKSLFQFPNLLTNSHRGILI